MVLPDGTERTLTDECLLVTDGEPEVLTDAAPKDPDVIQELMARYG